MLAVLLAPLTFAEGHRLGVRIVGARGRVPVRNPVTLEGKAQWAGPEAKLSYRWTSQKGPGLPYRADRTQPRIVFEPDDLTPGDYELRLEVTAEWTDPEMDPPEQLVQASSSIAFSVNHPPTGGRCEVEAEWVSPRVGRFTIVSEGWTDADDPRLQHRFSVSRGDKRQLLENWGRPNTHRLVLPAAAGEPLVFHCEVRDPMGDEAAAAAKPVQRP